MTQRWSSLPLDRVVHLLGASTEAFELATEPLPDDAPAVITYYPKPQTTMRDVVESLLLKLEADAIRLFPIWLPGSEGIEDASGAGVAAVRALALRLASQTVHFGPFLADLAEGAVRGRGRKVEGHPPEIRAAGLAKVIAASYHRDRTAILIDVPDGMSTIAQQALGGACEWLVAKGGFGIWLSGSTLAAADRVDTLRLELPRQIAEIVDAVRDTGLAVDQPIRGLVFYPPIAGVPRPDSDAEKRLEQALLGQVWAKGRMWNKPYPNRPQFVIDLLWTVERCAVEIDGPDHRHRLKFEKDRRRDVLLQLDGYAVLRFTNERIIGELDQVLAELKQFLEKQRD